MGLIRRIRPAVTIWYHQHEDLVDMAGGDRGVARRYAQLAHLRATCPAFLPGTAPGWQNHVLWGTTSFVVELPPGPGVAWYGDRLDPGWRPRSLAQSQAILDAVGLTGEFWRLS